MAGFSESIVEDVALASLEALGYAVVNEREIAAGEHGAERSDPNYRDVLLTAAASGARAPESRLSAGGAALAGSV
ncbi:MAG: hypothetical protein K0S45_2885 [Nitrospira sp.]|jgi:hypothetical protein|nr:hypothetical protein [Nitrospira sp.]